MTIRWCIIHETSVDEEADECWVYNEWRWGLKMLLPEYQRPCEIVEGALEFV